MRILDQKPKKRDRQRHNPALPDGEPDWTEVEGSEVTTDNCGVEVEEYYPQCQEQQVHAEIRYHLSFCANRATAGSGAGRTLKPLRMVAKRLRDRRTVGSSSNCSREPLYDLQLQGLSTTLELLKARVEGCQHSTGASQGPGE